MIIITICASNVIGGEYFKVKVPKGTTLGRVSDIYKQQFSIKDDDNVRFIFAGRLLSIYHTFTVDCCIHSSFNTNAIVNCDYANYACLPISLSYRAQWRPPFGMAKEKHPEWYKNNQKIKRHVVKIIVQQTDGIVVKFDKLMQLNMGRGPTLPRYYAKLMPNGQIFPIRFIGTHPHIEQILCQDAFFADTTCSWKPVDVEKECQVCFDDDKKMAVLGCGCTEICIECAEKLRSFDEYCPFARENHGKILAIHEFFVEQIT